MSLFGAVCWLTGGHGPWRIVGEKWLQCGTCGKMVEKR